MAIIKRIIKITLTIAPAIIMAFGLLVVAPAMPGSLHLYVVQSGSMEPAIRTGSLVAVMPSPEYSKGDVITFHEPGRSSLPITHRIVETKDLGAGQVYYTKGDANDVQDMQFVRKADVIGKVGVSIPYIGYAVGAARQPIGFMLLVILPAILIIVDEAKKFRGELKNIKKAEIKKAI